MRRGLLLAGGIAFAAGVVLAAHGGIALDRAFVSGAGVLALIQAARLVQGRREDERRFAGTPDPELPLSVPPPGDDLDGALTAFVGERRIFPRSRIHGGLEAAAVAVLARYAGLDEADARGRVDAGRWTDDPVAAAFVGEAVEPPVARRLRRAVPGLSTFRDDLRRTVDAIAAVAGIDVPERDGGSLPPRRFGSRPTGGGSRDDGPDRPAGEAWTTGHWRGVSAVALACVGLGVLAEAPGAVLAGAVGLGFGAYALSANPVPVSLSIERTLGDRDPDPGDEVEVSVTVRNDGDRALPDLRLVDGVPEALAVAGGSPRHATALRPGAETSFAYAVTARRGTHEFGGVLTIARDLTGGVEAARDVEVETTLSCVPNPRPTAVPVPLRGHVTRYAGRVETATGGEGVELYATREYRPGDPLSRIDWNRRARGDGFSTLQFREERAAAVVAVVDARPAAYVAPEGEVVHAVDRAVDAAGRAVARLLADGNRAGLAAMGPAACWIPPRSGEGHLTRVRDALATHPAFSPIPPSGSFDAREWERRLRRRAGRPTQFVFLSPLPDGEVVGIVRRFDARGYPAAVVAPDATADRTPGHRLARVARAIRISDLRDAGVPVVDWRRGESIDVALARGGRSR